MSVPAMELVLYDLGVKREARAGFASETAEFLKRYGLSAQEAEMVREFDIAALQQAGVSPLLTYGFWMTNAPVRTRAAYLERIRAKT